MKRIKLTKGKFALVDDEDFDKCNEYMWHYHNGNYAQRKNVFRENIFLHRFIMREPDSDIEHKDNDGLNCQKYNLRLCNDKQNQANSQGGKNGLSKFRGITFHKGKWRTQITGKRIHIGYFNNEIEAALAYNTIAIRMYGEFAKLNII